MKAGLTISTVAHAGLLLWGLVSFSARPLEAAPTPSLPVDIISDKQFSELAAGVKNAPKAETPKPLVDKVGATKPAEEMTPKVSDKPEIKTGAAPPPAEAKPEKAEAKPEKKEPPKVDAIAEALKKEEAKKKREEAKAKAAELKKQKEAAAAEVRSQADRRAARQARSAAPDRDRRRRQSDAVARLCQRAAGAIVAERDRCAAPPSQRMLEPAGRRRQRAESEGRVPRAVQARRIGRGAAGDGRRHRLALSARRWPKAPSARS